MKKQILLVFMSLSSWVLAQVKPVTQVSDLLGDLNVAACRQEEITEGQSRINNPVARRVHQPDLRCMATVQEIIPLLGKQDTFLIDTRHVDEYNAGHIDASMNLPPYAVRGQSFMKKNNVVLLGTGKADRELLTTCAELKDAGFKNVKVLRGGMISWAAMHMPWVGAELNLNQSGLLSAQDLAIEAGFSGNLILSTGGMGTMSGLVPGAVTIQDASAEALKKTLVKRKKELKKNDQFSALILLAGPKYDKTKIAETIRAMKPVPVLIYTNSTTDYEQYHATQKAIWTAQVRGPKQAKCQYQ